jgi:hypothetical protein
VTPRLCGLVDARWTSGELTPPASARMPTRPGESIPTKSNTLGICACAGMPVSQPREAVA